ncbi:PH (Pleckstrin Homology) domain-containing protein/putative oligomerization/nucleic acid binding protein [Staphylococcus epidermidis]
MKELPKNRLTMKEAWIEGDYLGTLSKIQKKEYKALSIEERRKILYDFKNTPRENVRFERETKSENKYLAKIYDRFNEIGVSDLFGTRKEVKELPMLLKENEEIMYVTSGLYDANTYLIVCTDLRLLFLDKGLIYGLKFHEFPFDKINSVSYKKGLMFGEILIHHGSSSITIGSIEKKTVAIMAETIQKQMENKKSFSKEITNTNSNFSVADELLKFKQLLDAGVISQEEFDKKKNELL